MIADVGTNKGGALYQSKIKTIKVSKKDEEKGLLNVYMDFDLDKETIHFSSFPWQGDTDVNQYLYFGNNSSAAIQYYVIRDAPGFLNYWTGRMHGIMMNLLETLGNGNLRSLLDECRRQELFDDQGICLDKIESISLTPSDTVCIDRKKKKVEKNGENIGAEAFLRQCLHTSGKEKLMLVVPRIIKNRAVYCISQEADYADLVNKSLGKTGGKGQQAVCYVCNKVCDDIDTVRYTSGLSRGSINKVFVSTTINYAPDFNKNKYNQNYALCQSCYGQLMFGEKKIMSQYRIKVAGENCILLFSGVVDPLDQSEFPVIKDVIDIAFQTENYANKEKRFLYKNTQKYFQFHMVFYQSDGKSTKVKKTIESISNLRFNNILDIFEEVRIPFGMMLPNFSLGHVYRMIPVCTNKKGEQLDIDRVLNFYGAILLGEYLEKALLFSLAAETLEKGMRELRAEKIRNYTNLFQLNKLVGKSYGPDVYISNMICMYMALFEVLQRLHIIDKEDSNMEKIPEMANVPEYVQQAEAFTARHAFSNMQKGLFYIGALTYQIGSAQVQQKHKTKPILDKISYSGMNKADVLTFYEDLLDKVRQYKNVKSCGWLLGKSEQIIKQIQSNLGHLDELNDISEQECVFYLMSGYAFFVKNRAKKNDNDSAGTEEGVSGDDSSEE